MASKAKMIRLDSSIPEESQLEDDGIPIPTAQDSNLPTRRAPSKRKETNALSLTSRKYDINGDGQLDEAEKAMRDLDTEGQGTLSNVEVYKIVKESMNNQRELFKLKRVVIGLVGFALLLTLANLGISSSWSVVLIGSSGMVCCCCWSLSPSGESSGSNR